MSLFAMRLSVYSILFSVASALGESNPPPQFPVVSSIISKTPRQCSPGESIRVSFEPSKLKTSLPEVQFQSTGHGRTEQYASCDFRVELNDWYYRHRVAISGATVTGHANLTGDVHIYQFNTTAVFRLEHLKNFSPITPPEISNLSLSTMFTQLTPTQIGGDDGFDDDFKVEAQPSSQLVWSPCFHGSEGDSQDSTFIDLIVSASSSDKNGQGTSELVSGLSVDWDLVWEECTPDWNEEYAWGQVRIDDWQSCTYRSANDQT